jgi:hypothetical protein
LSLEQKRFFIQERAVATNYDVMTAGGHDVVFCCNNTVLDEEQF